MEAECLLWGMRVVIPAACQGAVLKELHTSHTGIVRMKSLARIHVWWPGIDKHIIEGVVNSCEACKVVRHAPSPTVLYPWTWPDQPWKRIHIDFAGPFQGSMFLVIDSHSKWLEVIPMTYTTTERNLKVLSVLFSVHGLPEQIVSDNEPQFVSAEFELCMKKNGIKHIRSAPGHPATNGEAKRLKEP